MDGHLDIALNALRHERDQRLPVSEIRRREADGAADDRGTCTVTLPELRRGGVALVVSTVLARCKPWIRCSRVIGRADTDYPDPTMAYASAQGDLAYYRLLEGQGELQIIESAVALDRHLKAWDGGQTQAIGLILTMEGADPVVEPSQLSAWHGQGIRTLMLAHFGRSRYAAGTPSCDPANLHDVDGPITELGAALLEQMEALSMPLDLSHCSDQSFYSALEAFGGTIYSSHSCCRALVPENPHVHAMRMHADPQLRLIIERDGIIGLSMFNAHLFPGYQFPPESKPDSVSLSQVVDHVDHICQMAGSAKHVAIGSDLDGGFGCEHTPKGIDTIADLPRLSTVLQDRGFAAADVAAFLGGNWLRFWRGALPEK